MIMKRGCKESLVEEFGSEFKKLYLLGLPVQKIAKILGISQWYGFELKRTLNLKLERWQKINLPEKFSNKTIQILYGTLLGDGSLYKRSSNGHVVFSLSHSPKQESYLQHKRELLQELKPYPIADSGDKWGTLQMRVVPHPEFDKIYKVFYPNGKKIVSREILNKLSPLSIAIWFMDDGNISSDKSSFSIATCSFSLEEHKLIKDYFKNKWGIDCVVKIYKYPRLYIYGQSALKFKKLIKKHVIPSMQYKLELKSGIGAGKSFRKLTLSDVDFIKEIHAKNISQRDIVRELKSQKNIEITQSQVSRILSGKRWSKHDSHSMV